MTIGAPGSPDPAAELQCALSTCAVFDRSDLGRLIATGPDILGLLHRLSTAAVAGLQPGEGRATVLTTAKGRIVERLYVHHLGPPGVLLAGGSGRAARVAAHIQRYTFAEQIGLSDATADTFQLALVGPRASQVLEALGAQPPAPCQVREAVLGGSACHVLGQDGLSLAGFSVVGPAQAAERVGSAVLRALSTVGGLPGGALALEAYRILRGLPAAQHELTEDHNPLEAGLWDAVDFDKGCYVGQEVVARLRTYDKISRAIVGLDLSPGAAPPAGAPLSVGGRAVGQLTSVVVPPGWSHAIGLGYLKRREIRPGVELEIGDGAGNARLVELPFPGPA